MQEIKDFLSNPTAKVENKKALLKRLASESGARLTQGQGRGSAAGVRCGAARHSAASCRWAWSHQGGSAQREMVQGQETPQGACLQPFVLGSRARPTSRAAAQLSTAWSSGVHWGRWRRAKRGPGPKRAQQHVAGQAHRTSCRAGHTAPYLDPSHTTSSHPPAHCAPSLSPCCPRAGFNQYTLNFLNLLVDTNRIDAIEEICESFETSYCELTDTQVGGPEPPRGRLGHCRGGARCIDA